MVSIIIPVYNVEPFIHRCIQSILSQTYNNLEIILVDDGSPDNCPQICDEYAEKDNRVKVIHKQNGGVSSARNAALDIMKGDYCLFVDSDDYIHLRCIEYMIGLAERYYADLVQCELRIVYSDEYGQDPFKKDTSEFVFTNRNIFASTKNNVVLCGKLYKSDIWKGIRMPVGRLNEDDATAWKLYYAAKTIVTSDKQLYYYWKNPNGIMSNFSRVPNIEFPMLAYHERIDFFDGIGDKYLSDLSKWRYSKYLMLSFGNSKLSKEQYSTLISEFKKIYKDVLFCKPVPLSHKILIVLCRIAPCISSKFINKIRG